MKFLKPTYYEIFLANFKNDDWCDEVHVATINSERDIITHLPIDLFFYSRKYAMVIGQIENGDWISKDYMSVRTTKQEYAGWPIIKAPEDLEGIFELIIHKEKNKQKKYHHDSRKYSFWQDYY